jgi:methylmalonyl-CoA mutase C-terminal domain/subunit
MHKKPIRILIAKPGLDGHESGAKLIARGLADAGMEVIYTGPRQTPQMIVNSAIQENVDIVGLSILSGAHMELSRRLMGLFRQNRVEEIPVILGGIIPESDFTALKEMGIREIFGPGTRINQVVAYIQNLVGSAQDHPPEGDLNR